MNCDDGPSGFGCGRYYYYHHRQRYYYYYHHHHCYHHHRRRRRRRSLRRRYARCVVSCFPLHDRLPLFRQIPLQLLLKPIIRRHVVCIWNIMRVQLPR